MPRDINISFVLPSSSAYMGNLRAMLIYPARARSPDTFEDLVKLSDRFTFGIKRYSSHQQLLHDSTDPVLKVTFLFWQV